MIPGQRTSNRCHMLQLRPSRAKKTKQMISRVEAIGVMRFGQFLDKI